MTQKGFVDLVMRNHGAIKVGSSGYW